MSLQDEYNKLKKQIKSAHEVKNVYADFRRNDEQGYYTTIELIKDLEEELKEIEEEIKYEEQFF